MTQQPPPESGKMGGCLPWIVGLVVLLLLGIAAVYGFVYFLYSDY